MSVSTRPPSRRARSAASRLVAANGDRLEDVPGWDAKRGALVMDASLAALSARPSTTGNGAAPARAAARKTERTGPAPKGTAARAPQTR